MKVCGKKDVHLPECDDCQELEERVEAVEECCDDAHGEIDTLTTEKADKSYVDLGLDNVDHKIDDGIDAVNERIDDIITASEPSITTLWEGVLTNNGDSVHLSDDVNNYDFLDVYYKTSEYEDQGYYGYIRVPAVEYVNYTTTIGGTKRPASGEDLSQYLTMLSFVDDTANIMNIREWSWNGDSASDAVDDNQPFSGIIIYRIDGGKETGGNLEIADARIGVDGTVYPSLGDAIRGQIQDTRDMIPQLVKTVQGNPIVLDDAFGEVKKLDVELLPIQDLHGYSKPWAGGAGKNKAESLTTLTTYTSNDIIWTTTDGYTIHVQGTASAQSLCALASDWSKLFHAYLPAGTYRASTDSDINLRVGVGSSNTNQGNAAGGFSFTLASDNDVWIGLFVASGKQVNKDIHVQLEAGSTVTTYEPYSNICPITGHDSVTVTDTDGDTQSQSKTVTLPHTVYGAGVGVTSGNGKEKISAPLDIGTLSWTYRNGLFDAVLSDGKKTPYSTGNSQNTCSAYETVHKAYTILADGQMAVGTGYVNGSTCSVLVKDTRFTDAASFKQAVSGVMLCYELDTYTDLSTTPTSLTLYNGDNVISSDGDMELTYVQDMAIVIRKIENQL